MNLKDLFEGVDASMRDHLQDAMDNAVASQLAVLEPFNPHPDALKAFLQVMSMRGVAGVVIAWKDKPIVRVLKHWSKRDRKEGRKPVYDIAVIDLRVPYKLDPKQDEVSILGMPVKLC